MTQQYTIIKPTDFYNKGLGSSTLNPGVSDSVRFVIQNTDSTEGLATIRGKLFVTDLISTDQLEIDTDGNSASLTVQSPADLAITFVSSSQSSATRGQDSSWTVTANISNSGESTIRIDTSAVSTFLKFDFGTDYKVKQPEELTTGGFDLTGNQSSSLIFTIEKTTTRLGADFIYAIVNGSEVNSGRPITKESSLFVLMTIQTPAEIQILSTTISAVTAPGAPDVNAGQEFDVDVTIKNNGGAKTFVTAGLVTMVTNGPSSFTPTQNVGFISGGSERTASFRVTASQNIGTSELFTSSIEQAIESNTNAPAIISQSIDSTATINIEKPAGLVIVSVESID